MRNEKQLLVDCLERLERSGIDYMLTGSMASNVWGIPRTTHDIDVVIQMDRGSIARFIDVFREGFFIQSESVRSAFQPPYQFNIIDNQSSLKVDFWMLRDDDSFESEAFRRRQRIELFGPTAWIGTAEDILLHKLKWNEISPSDRQLADAAGIVVVQGESLDRPYLELWATQLGVTTTLADVLSGKIRPKHT